MTVPKTALIVASPLVGPDRADEGMRTGDAELIRARASHPSCAGLAGSQRWSSGATGWLPGAGVMRLALVPGEGR